MVLNVRLKEADAAEQAHKKNMQELLSRYEVEFEQAVSNPQVTPERIVELHRAVSALRSELNL